MDFFVCGGLILMRPILITGIRRVRSLFLCFLPHGTR